MYVADERFAANYGGADGATFVRDAMKEYADAQPLAWSSSAGSALAWIAGADLSPRRHRGTRSSGSVTLTIGPISSAKATVPMPTWPPSSQPMVSTVTSIAVRTIQIFQPVRSVQAGHQAVARAGAEAGADVQAGRDGEQHEAAGEDEALDATGAVCCGISQSPSCALGPMSSTLSTVPTPGFWRIGIQSSSTSDADQVGHEAERQAGLLARRPG